MSIVFRTLNLSKTGISAALILLALATGVACADDVRSVSRTQKSVKDSSTSIYSWVNDRKLCRYKEIKGDSCEFLCDGPVAGVRTKLLSCADYEHLFFELDGKWYSTWEAMLQVGGFSGLANKQGLVEWVFRPKGNNQARELRGLIVRFSGTNQNGQTKNALSVFSLSHERVCWNGNFPDNLSARQALREDNCLNKLGVEKNE
jgi:hypothetical protein